jgi:transcriptional regulator with XRE-family HTH domain
MADRVPGSPLRIARVAAGYRLEALAKAVGLKSENTLYRIETGRTKQPKQETRRRLAAVLGVSEAALFGKVGR